jgi:hypothetical protein
MQSPVIKIFIMDRQRIRRSLRSSAVAFIIAAGTMTTLLAREKVRTVAVLTIFVAGVAAGVFLVNFFMYRKAGKEEQ